eukprot:1105153_1
MFGKINCKFASFISHLMITFSSFTLNNIRCMHSSICSTSSLIHVKLIYSCFESKVLKQRIQILMIIFADVLFMSCIITISCHLMSDHREQIFSLLFLLYVHTIIVITFIMNA